MDAHRNLLNITITRLGRFLQFNCINRGIVRIVVFFSPRVVSTDQLGFLMEAFLIRVESSSFLPRLLPPAERAGFILPCAILCSCLDESFTERILSTQTRFYRIDC